MSLCVKSESVSAGAFFSNEKIVNVLISCCFPSLSAVLCPLCFLCFLSFFLSFCLSFFLCFFLFYLFFLSGVHLLLFLQNLWTLCAATVERRTILGVVQAGAGGAAEPMGASKEGQLESDASNVRLDDVVGRIAQMEAMRI